MRIIDQLRKAYPNVTWTYARARFRWLSSAGWCVQAFGVLTNCCYNGCDHSRTEYRRSDTNDVVYGLLFYA